MTLSYRVSRPAKSMIKIFDPEMKLVRELFLENPGELESNYVRWDGRDLVGRTVPDEAYFFTIEASDFHGNFTFYDPTVISGREAFSPEARFDSGRHLLSYQLERDSRVNIRVGISGGPLLKIVLNWSPRTSGHHEEEWDGMDESDVIDVLNERAYRLSVETVGLPENSIIAKGNADYDYFEYKTEIAPDRPKKPERPRPKAKTLGLGPDPMVPRRMGPEPKFRLVLPSGIKRTEDGLPIVGGKTPIRVILDEKVKRYITEERYEIVVFVDFEFVTEMEEGFSPITFLWDTRKLDNGEHILTVNVVTLSGRVSSGSLRAVVQNRLE